MRFDSPIKLDELAAISGARVMGAGDFAVMGLGSLESARADEVSFVRSADMRERALSSGAGALLVPEDFGDIDRPALVAEDVDRALALVGEALAARACPPPGPGVHPSAIVGEGVTLGEGASVGPCAVIEPGASLGPGARVGAGAYLGRGVEIGAGTTVHANATIHWGCRVGERCVVHSGAVIGADGFGFARDADGSYRKIPQLGNVVLEDDVEIGACTCIDRAMIDSTVIARGVKLDNQVHIAHNCRVGEGTAMAAQVGIAGSTTVGARCQLGGQVGITGHVAIGDDVVINAATPVIGSVPDGAEWWGFPGREKAKALRETAAAARSVKLFAEVRALRRRLRALEEPPGGAAPQ